MKPEESFHEIGELLRSQKPDVTPAPDLEQRILQALNRRQPRTPRLWWPWLVLPPAFAATTLLLWPRPAEPLPEIARHPLPVAAPAISLADLGNPLAAETAALGRDARRVGNFLIHSLPSLSSVGE